MRVLLDVSAVPAEPRGAGVYVVELARGLAAAEPVDLVLLARRGDAPRWRDVAPGAEVHAPVPSSRPARLAWEQLQGPATARRLAAEVWHGPHYTLPLRLHLPSVVTVHDLTFIEHPEWHERAKARFFRGMIPAAAARATVCVCVSAHTAARLAARTGRDGDTVVIPHGVDHDRFRPEADLGADLEVLAALGVEPPYVAFLGTLEPRKNIPALVEAFATVSPAHPELRLVIAGGGGWGEDAVVRAIDEHGVAARVVRTGYVDHETVPALLRRAACVAYPSLEEGFGLPALEALACGAPLLATCGSAVEETVGDAAVLAAGTDTGSLVAALEQVLERGCAARLRVAGPARAAPYTWAASVAAHVEVYERIGARLR
jgi:glycosyltransferase involved in cell wall biosynthesis